MKWFRTSSSDSIASQENEKIKQRHKRIKKTTKSNKTTIIPTIKCMQLEECCEAFMMTTSLCQLSYETVQIVDPEDFFEDPVHVSNYRAEASFLSLMSEWEIVENHSMSENYFSADFEEELVMRTHNSSMCTVTCHSTDTLSSVEKYSPSSLSSAASFLSQKLDCKQTLAEILFADKIQLGILLPLSMSNDQPKKLARKRKLRSKYIQTQTDTSTQTETELIKDYAIARTQFETEAYARSIMGAIMHAPIDHHLSNCCVFNCDHYDIKKRFHLDDEGNILLNINHIEEINGYGFTVAHNKRLYKRYLKHTQMACDTTIYCTNSCLYALRRTLQLVWHLVCGHPRNKVNPYGAGPGDSVRSYTLQLAQDPTSTFARNIENFISCTKESREAAPQVVMRNMRQFMNGMKNYLVKHGEAKFHQEVEIARARLKSDEFLNLDAILETVMHKLVVLPLREHLYGMFVDYYTRTEDIQLLAQNVKYACGRCAADFGIRACVTPPSVYSLNLISNILLRLQEAELPLEKLDLFLSVITTIFEATGCPRGQQLGADDFLPILVYVVAKCGFVGAEIEAEFMWGLLQPTLLNGEPGYYLTALCSAVHVLKSFMASENESGSGSLDVSIKKSYKSL